MHPIFSFIVSLSPFIFPCFMLRIILLFDRVKLSLLMSRLNSQRDEAVVVDQVALQNVSTRS